MQAIWKTRKIRFTYFLCGHDVTLRGLCFGPSNITASSNFSDHITLDKGFYYIEHVFTKGKVNIQINTKVLKQSHYIGMSPQNLASKCLNLTVLEKEFPPGNGNVSSTVGNSI